MNLKTLLLASAGVLALGAGSAWATTFVETVNFGDYNTSPNATVSSSTDPTNAVGVTAHVPDYHTLVKFDASSSSTTLNFITFNYSYRISSNITVTNAATAQDNAGGSAGTDSSVRFSSDDVNINAALNKIINTNATGTTSGANTLAPIAYDVFSNQVNFAAVKPGTNQTQSVKGEQSGSVTLNNTADNATLIAAFEGANSATFTPLISTLTRLDSSISGGNNNISQVTTYGGYLTITYDFTTADAPPPPPTGVPEPASMALLGAGLVGLGVFRRRRA